MYTRTRRSRFLCSRCSCSVPFSPSRPLSSYTQPARAVAAAEPIPGTYAALHSAGASAEQSGMAPSDDPQCQCLLTKGNGRAGLITLLVLLCPLHQY
jgi:hypothetical protein